MAVWQVCYQVDTRVSKQVSAVIRSMLGNFLLMLIRSTCRGKLLRQTASLLSSPVKSPSHRRPFGIPSITADDQEATAVKKSKWRFMEGDGGEYPPPQDGSFPHTACNPPTMAQVAAWEGGGLPFQGIIHSHLIFISYGEIHDHGWF